MSAAFMFSALSQIGAPVMVWAAVAACAAMDYMFYMCLRTGGINGRF